MDGLTASGVVVRFGGLVALDGVGVEAPPGRITGLIGPNGAGKTTFFNVISGFQVADEGTVHLGEADITRDTPTRRARMGIGRTFQRMELFRSLTVRENIALAAESLHVGNDPFTQLALAGAGPKVWSEVADTTEALLSSCGLAHLADHTAGEVSTGEGRLVELARALARRPRILLLDEPSSGLDARETEAFGRLLVQVVEEQGVGILMIEHDMSLVLKICGWIHVLEFGKPLMAGTPTEVRSSKLVRDAYLGKGAA